MSAGIEVGADQVRFPDAWNNFLVPRATGSSQLTPADAVRGAVPPVFDREAMAFVDQLRRRLRMSTYAEVVGIDERCRYGATAAVAVALGGLTGIPPGPLGGELTEVVTSTVYDHNLAWHTDSTSWERPNRWQILTLVTPDGMGRSAPTSVLPWTTVLRAVPKQSARTLEATMFGWREQFSDLRPLQAPILGPFPRWLRPALAGHLDEEGTFSCPALDDLSRAIFEAVDFVDVELTTSSLLVFDNHAALHRGPHLDPDGGRTIIRLKLGGIVGDLGLSTTA